MIKISCFEDSIEETLSHFYIDMSQVNFIFEGHIKQKDEK